MTDQTDLIPTHWDSMQIQIPISADPYVIKPDDKNLNYKFGTMCNETVIAQTSARKWLQSTEL